MAENSNIAWTDHTFNPWIGCTKVGPGCDHCYAEAWDRRFAGDAPHWGPGAPRRRTTVQNWNKVRKWNRVAAAARFAGAAYKPVRVFIASLADVFDNEVPEEWRCNLWDLIDECNDLEFILVTKRAGNVAKMAPAGGFGRGVILVSTIVNQMEADRDLSKLVDLKRSGVASKIGVSYEPALGPVDWSRWLPRDGGPIYDGAGGTMDVMDPEVGIDWLIVGGESNQGGAKARTFDVEWARSSIRQCSAAGVPVFIKQLGSRCRMDVFGSSLPEIHHLDNAGGNILDWPADLYIRQFPVIGGRP